MDIRRGSLEKRVLNPSFWRSRRVLITGHTGFKGSWLTLWLKTLRAEVTGYALPPVSEAGLYVDAAIGEGVTSIQGDVRDVERLRSVVRQSEPEVVFHMAAQSLVRRSYQDPLETYTTNVIGTANVLQALRTNDTAVVVNVTSDKCYANAGESRPLTEEDPLGGQDPYSSSKAAAELVTHAYRESFFSGERIASVRAGNVIGSCDWAQDRLIPDLARAALTGKAAQIRNPDAVRPWQHVLDCLAGYLILAEALTQGGGAATAWNFGPEPGEDLAVRRVAEEFARLWPGPLQWELQAGEHPTEAPVLRLDSSKARRELGWTPRLTLNQAIEWTVSGYQAAAEPSTLSRVLFEQIETYMDSTGII